MSKIDLKCVPERKGSTYPSPYNDQTNERIKQALGNAGGLTQFGVNLTRLPPGAWSSQRHWHSGDDEFVYMISGEVALITDAGEEKISAGDCVAFPRNTPNGHHLINKGPATAVFLEVGTRNPDDVCTYAEIDMVADKKFGGYRHKDGTPY
jgi:uncharacterized cupin superfamily protein